MFSENVNEKLRELEQQILKAYNNTSILDDVCTLEPVEPNFNLGRFEQFASRYAIERSRIMDSTNYLILGELGKSVARSEINLLLQQFSQESTTRTVDAFSIQEIQNSVYHLQNQDFMPHTVFIPSSHFNEVFDWNQGQKARYPGLQENTMARLIIGPNTILKVKYSSKYAQFDNVIITSKDANLWQFRPDEITQHRLTARFDWENADPENTILLIRTIFNFQIQSPEANIILNFPERVNENL